MANRHVLFSLLFLLNTCFLNAQTEELIGIELPSGKKETFELAILPIAHLSVKDKNFYPHILITNTELARVNPTYAADFQALVLEQNTLYQYRYLESLAQNDRFWGATRGIQRQMFLFRKQLSATNLIPHMLEFKLQLKLEEYFPTSQCYAYNTHRNPNLGLDSIAKNFKADFLISPQILIIDTLHGETISTLQFDFYASDRDSVVTKSIKVKGNNITEAIESLVDDCCQFIMSTMFKQSTNRAMVKTYRSRANSTASQLITDNAHPSQLELDAKLAKDEKLGYLVNDADDKAITFYLREYQADFKEKLKDVLYTNPYPDIDVNTFKDPNGITYMADIYTSFKYKGKWISILYDQTPLHTSEYEKAKNQALQKLSKLECFEPDSLQLNQRSWELGAFLPVDTQAIAAEGNTISDSIELHNHKTKVNKFKPYQGVSTSLANYLYFQYLLSENLAFADSLTQALLLPAFLKLGRQRLYNFRNVPSEKRKYTLIHNFERTQVLIPVFVEEPFGRTYLRFFYWDAEKPTEIKEWTYVDKYYLNKRIHYNQVVLSQMNKVICWNFLYGSINDPAFWESKVTREQDGKPLYLTKLDIPGL